MSLFGYGSRNVSYPTIACTRRSYVRESQPHRQASDDVCWRCFCSSSRRPPAAAVAAASTFDALVSSTFL